MAILLGQGGAKNDEVKGVAAQCFLNALALEGGGDMMPALAISAAWAVRVSSSLSP